MAVLQKKVSQQFGLSLSTRIQWIAHTHKHTHWHTDTQTHTHSQHVCPLIYTKSDRQLMGVTIDHKVELLNDSLNRWF